MGVSRPSWVRSREGVYGGSVSGSCCVENGRRESGENEWPDEARRQRFVHEIRFAKLQATSRLSVFRNHSPGTLPSFTANHTLPRRPLPSICFAPHSATKLNRHTGQSTARVPTCASVFPPIPNSRRKFSTDSGRGGRKRRMVA
jgi:hypothetical protein